MSAPPLTFTGVSTFSNDFQTILDRAAQIAQIPVTALQNRDSDILQKKNLLTGLASAVSGLATSLSSLGTTAKNQALTATSSDPAAVTVINSGATSAASYTINSITSPASAAAETSLSGYADAAATPVSSTGNVNLVVGGVDHPFALDNNTLVGLRDKINSLGAGVTASILTTGGGNYLSISANATGATSLKLFDDPTPGANTNLLTSTNQGSDAVFKLNGIPVHQSGNVVNSVVPGLTFTIQKASASPVTLSLATDPSQLASALQSFVSNYNTVRQQVNAQTGPAGGLLSGDTVVEQLQNQLRILTSYRTSGSTVNGLADLGIEFDSSGHASFDSTKFNSLSQAGIADALAFVGSPATGLGAFSASLTQFSDPVGGLIKTEQDGLDRTDKSIQAEITAATDRNAIAQHSLTLRLQQADALVAALQSQQQELTATIQGLDLVLFGKASGSP